MAQTLYTKFTKIPCLRGGVKKIAIVIDRLKAWAMYPSNPFQNFRAELIGKIDLDFFNFK